MVSTGNVPFEMAPAEAARCTVVPVIRLSEAKSALAGMRFWGTVNTVVRSLATLALRAAACFRGLERRVAKVNVRSRCRSKWENEYPTAPAFSAVGRIDRGRPNRRPGIVDRHPRLSARRERATAGGRYLSWPIRRVLLNRD